MFCDAKKKFSHRFLSRHLIRGRILRVMGACTHPGVDWHVSVHSSWECVHRVILNVEGHSSGQSLWEEYLHIYPGTYPWNM